MSSCREGLTTVRECTIVVLYNHDGIPFDRGQARADTNHLCTHVHHRAYNTHKPYLQHLYAFDYHHTIINCVTHRTSQSHHPHTMSRTAPPSHTTHTPCHAPPTHHTPSIHPCTHNPQYQSTYVPRYCQSSVPRYVGTYMNTYLM